MEADLSAQMPINDHRNMCATAMTQTRRKTKTRRPESVGLPVVFVIGRPGAGKTTIVAGLRTRFERLLSSRRLVYVVDEFDILCSFANNDSCSRVQRNPEGRIEIVDAESVFASTIQSVERRVMSRVSEGGIVLCEFARSSYVPVFSGLSRTLVDRAWVLYICAPLSLCSERNEERKIQDAERYVPEIVLNRQYADDDVGELARMFGARLWLIQNDTVFIGALDKEIDECLQKSGLGNALAQVHGG